MQLWLVRGTRLFALLLLTTFLGASLTGCPPGPVAGADAGDALDDMGDDSDVSDVSGTPYYYVLVDDREPASTSSSTNTAGIDIDSIQLNSGLETFNVGRVESCAFGDGENEGNRDCTAVMGPPDSACDWRALDGSFVSLGGDGGNIVVSFGNREEIRTGDTIVVTECGRSQNPSATDEHYDLFIGVATSVTDGNWVECLRDATGIAECVVPNLPLVPVD